MDLQVSHSRPAPILPENEGAKKLAPRPDIFHYTNFRFFLLDFFLFLKSKNSRYSETAFMTKAGFGKNSRGYFKLIVSGKRNLSLDTITGLSLAMNLNDKEQQFFEYLVRFNQSKQDKDKEMNWKRLSELMKGKENNSFRLLRAQYNYYNNWYLVAIREMVALDDFQNDLDFISHKLKTEVSKKEIQLALDDLFDLRLLKKNEEGKLEQFLPAVEFADNRDNYKAVESFQKQMLEMAKSALNSDPYESRSISNLTFVCDREDFQRIREDLARFRKELIEKYETKATKKNIVLNLGMNLIKLTK